MDTSTYTSEDYLQSKCIEWSWNYRPQTRRLIWAVPNGGFRNMIEAMKMKATGTLEGVWDIHFYWHGQFNIIEMKVGNNQLSVDRVLKGKKHYGQKEWGELMERHGARKFVCRSLEDYQLAIDTILAFTVAPNSADRDELG